MSEGDLFAAVQDQNPVAVRQILEQHPEAALARDADGATALHYATETGNREIVRLLLDAGADINARDQHFHATPAGWAIEYLRMRGGLLGIEIEEALRAITNGDESLLRHYLARLPALREAVAKDGTSLRHHAQNAGDPAIARLFDT